MNVINPPDEKSVRQLQEELVKLQQESSKQSKIHLTIEIVVGIIALATLIATIVK